MARGLFIATICWIIYGLFTHYTYAIFGIAQFSYWTKFYFLWDKTKDLMLISWGLFPYTYKKYRYELICMFYLLSVRIIWDIVALIDWESANHPNIILGLLLNLTVICILIVFKNATIKLFNKMAEIKLIVWLNYFGWGATGIGFLGWIGNLETINGIFYTAFLVPFAIYKIYNLHLDTKEKKLRHKKLEHELEQQIELDKS